MDLPRPFGPYVLERSLARGGMGEIFLARTGTPGFNKRLCIKQVRPPPMDASDFAAMFRDEAALAAKLHHPNIVEVFDFGEVDGSLYLAMEYVDGMTLGALLKEHVLHQHPLELAVGVQVGIALCRALQHAHVLTGEDGKPLGVVHRDVSPENVLLSALGEVKLADFGIARAEDRLVTTRTGQTKGKGAYMAPEQAAAEPVDHRTDQFAIGILLWEMFACRRLFRGKTDLDAMRRVLRADVRPPSAARPDVPPALDQAVLRALSRRPEDRFPDMAALEAALSEALFDVVKTPADLDLRPVVRRALAGPWPEKASDEVSGTIPVRRHMSDDTIPGPRLEERTEPAITVVDHEEDDEVDTTATVPMPPAPGISVALRPLPTEGAAEGAALAFDEKTTRTPLVVGAVVAVVAVVVVVFVALALLSRGDVEPQSVLARAVVATVPATEETPVAAETETEADRAAEVKDEASGPETSLDDIGAPGAEEPPSGRSGARSSSGKRGARSSSPSSPSSPSSSSPSPMELAAELDEMEREAMRALITGKPTSAAYLLREVVRLEPRRASAYRGLGQANEALGQKRPALAAYRVYLSLSPGAPDRETVAARISELSR